ncbi:serine/threonine protein kinase [Mycolicibacterium frederiksbergense]|uniref:non-specific serine/threonine protein kinase n=2 Tax=Mycolicibacterium frederiksbergense TaxID=117567 RepID=A0A6H0S0B8_9MYCO|nr:serine/threonine-protein kinase [Mycolicibacterium frederiksbergense]QIV80151.1 serine/threonine protein kinase [Mycolicibacterium frederiksbergense]
MEGTPFGRYRLVKVLGRGGMGEVWQAYDTAMNRVVALKVLPANLADDDTYQRRFRREAQMAAGLDEPHIVPIHDFGEIDGRLYVTMRLIDGKTVHELLGTGPLPPQRAVGITEQIAAALHAAHRVGLVHRDVKPSNILVTDEDFAYLIDFGIARAAGATKLTSTGSTIGTLAYMAPERLSTDTSDARADVYALTCVLHECLTGSQPFPGDSVERQIAGHLTLPPPRPSALQPGVPTQLDRVIATGMAKNPEHRYASTRDLATAARAATAPPVAHAHQPTATSWPTPVPYPPSGNTAAPQQQHWPSAPGPHWQQPMPPSRPWWRGPAVLIPIGLLGVAGVVAVAITLVVTGRSESTTGQQVATQRTSSVLPTSSSAPQTNSTAAPSTQVGIPAQLQSAEGLAALLQSLRDKFGDTIGYQLAVYPTHAVIERADPANSHVAHSYIHRGDGWQEWGSPSSTSSFDHLADLGGFDAPAVTETLADAPQTLGAPPDSGTYLLVEGAEGGGLELAIYSTAPGTGFMQVNPDGSIKQVFPP